MPVIEKPAPTLEISRGALRRACLKAQDVLPNFATKAKGQKGLRLSRLPQISHSPNSNGLQPTSDGLQPTSHGLQPSSDVLLMHKNVRQLVVPTSLRRAIPLRLLKNATVLFNRDEGSKTIKYKLSSHQ